MFCYMAKPRPTRHCWCITWRTKWQIPENRRMIHHLLSLTAMPSFMHAVVSRRLSVIWRGKYSAVCQSPATYIFFTDCYHEVSIKSFFLYGQTRCTEVNKACFSLFMSRYQSKTVGKLGDSGIDISLLPVLWCPCVLWTNKLWLCGRRRVRPTRYVPAHVQ